MSFEEWWKNTPPDFHVGNYDEEAIARAAWDAAKRDMAPELYDSIHKLWPHESLGKEFEDVLYGNLDELIVRT
jgi:hypothetical protein